MIGKSPLWVSKQHGHRPETMFRAYAAWAEGAPESEVAVIREAMGLDDQRLSKKAPRVGTKIGTSDLAPAAKPLKTMDLIGGKGGTRTDCEISNLTYGFVEQWDPPQSPPIPGYGNGFGSRRRRLNFI
jgi:hypothetical protein